MILRSQSLSKADILAVLALKQQVREYDFLDLIDVDFYRGCAESGST